MRNTLLWCMASVLVTSTLMMGIVLFTLDGGQPAGNSASEPIVQNEEGQYIVKTHQGRVAVFIRGKEEPEIVYDVYVQQLPSFDQGQLSQGIYVSDYQTLMRLLEDYIS